MIYSARNPVTTTSETSWQMWIKSAISPAYSKCEHLHVCKIINYL